MGKIGIELVLTKEELMELIRLMRLANKKGELLEKLTLAWEAINEK